MWNQHLMNRLQNVVFLLVMCGGLFVAPVAVSAETLEPANAAQNERFYAVLLSYQMNRLQNVVFLLVMCGGLFVAPVAVSAETLEPANAAQNERFYAVLLSY